MIKDNIFKIRQRIALACSQSGRSAGDISVVAVTKGRNIDQIKEVVAAGITDIGENRVQEALIKYNQLTAYSLQLTAIKWHMVGHLQTNKAKDAVGIFDLIQSVDSLRLAQEIDKQAAWINKIQDILIEIKTSPESTKSGLKPDEAVGVIKDMAKLKNINIQGLMTIAPLVDNPEKARPYFRILRELRDKINALAVTRNPLPVLSMGMTDDFEVAIEEGATMLRLGRAIFGD